MVNQNAIDNAITDYSTISNSSGGDTGAEIQTDDQGSNENPQELNTEADDSEVAAAASAVMLL